MHTLSLLFLSYVYQKQATHGLNQNFQVSTTKWATSLRNVSVDKNDPYGVVPVSVAVGHKEKKQAKAAESMFSRVISKYGFADSKISDTIHAFTQNVPHPTLDDLGELDRVLSEHVIRTNRKADAKRKGRNLHTLSFTLESPSRG
jgi:hypothetical protein